LAPIANDLLGCCDLDLGGLSLAYLMLVSTLIFLITILIFVVLVAIIGNPLGCALGCNCLVIFLVVVLVIVCGNPLGYGFGYS
jgi:hypothetical protein